MPRALPQPATFRLQGLATLLAAYSRRARAGSFSHRQRSWDSPFGAFPSRKVSATFPGGSTHLPFLPPLFPLPRQRAGPTSRGFWAPTLSRVPGGPAGVNSPATGCSLGFRPLRVSQRKPCPGFRPSSTHTLSRAGRETSPAGAPESRSTSTWFRPPRPANRATRTEQPFQGSRTSTIPHIRAGTHPGYAFTSYRAVHCCRQTDNPWMSALPYRSCPGLV
jgi:hypothetical protein